MSVWTEYERVLREARMTMRLASKHVSAQPAAKEWHPLICDLRDQLEAKADLLFDLENKLDAVRRARGAK